MHLINLYSIKQLMLIVIGFVVLGIGILVENYAVIFFAWLVTMAGAYPAWTRMRHGGYKHGGGEWHWFSDEEHLKTDTDNLKDCP